MTDHGYAVIHAYPISATRTDYGFCSSPYEIGTRLTPEAAYEIAENHLAYCQDMQEREKPGSAGEYFIVRWERA